MSKMAQLHMEMVELIEQGYGPVAISAMTCIPLNIAQDFFDATMRDSWNGQDYDENEIGVEST
jgi:hypothetical protein